MQQSFDVRVYDEFAIIGNTGVLRCQLPNYLQDFVSVNAWIRSDGYVVKAYAPTDMNSKYLMFATGELHIKSVRQEDSDFTFRCQIMDHLTAKISLSSTAGRLIVTESQAIAPRFVHRMSAIKVRVNSVAMIPCAAEAFPSIAIKWYKHSKGSGEQLSPLSTLSMIELNAVRIQEHSDGTLIINDVNIDDSGSYLCVVNNNIGEQKSLTQLTVTAFPINLPVK
ncbi:Down syndrome cell adhesion molecule-like protein [Leptotrombidium deliense]|uniref:Down syndrome cell adhesion molecule-like protein n=1 Tax=Leptotrombidium deliense TaxID=299467 RepID=A0A443SBB1_9ACAR|nr:Down syndrome cell adhesion molecule-like protein [Leptotrombidium deliense]